MSKAEKSFFISFKKPHGRITRDTLARWLRTLMGQAGINTEHFKHLSDRRLYLKLVQNIYQWQKLWLKLAGAESTFQKLDCKPVIQDTISFANTVLAD